MKQKITLVGAVMFLMAFCSNAFAVKTTDQVSFSAWCILASDGSMTAPDDVRIVTVLDGAEVFDGTYDAVDGEVDAADPHGVLQFSALWSVVDGTAAGAAGVYNVTVWGLDDGQDATPCGQFVFTVGNEDVNVASVDADAIGVGDLATGAIDADAVGSTGAGEMADSVWGLAARTITGDSYTPDVNVVSANTSSIENGDVAVLDCNVESMDANAIGVGDFADNCITDAAIADDAFTYATFAATAPTAWWNEGKTGYTVSTVSDKTGYTLSAAGVDAIWDEDSTGHYTSPHMAFVSAQTSASSTDTANIKTMLNNNWTSAASGAGWAKMLADTTWDALLADHVDSGSFGALQALVPVQSTVDYDAANNPALFKVHLAEATTDHYEGMMIVFLSGAEAGHGRTITSYNGSSKLLGVKPVFLSTPADGDKFSIIGSRGGLEAFDPAYNQVDVGVGNVVGIDWGNVGNPTSAVSLTNTTVAAVTNTATINSLAPPTNWNTLTIANNSVYSDIRYWEGANVDSTATGIPDLSVGIKTNGIVEESFDDGSIYIDAIHTSVFAATGQYAADSVLGRLLVDGDSLIVDQSSLEDMTVATVTNQVTADVTEISGDATAADNLETMLDGTGGQTFSLGRLAIVGANSTNASFYVENSSGVAVKWDATGGGGHGFHVSADSAGRGVFFEADSTGEGFSVHGGSHDGDGFSAWGIAGIGISATGGGSNYGMYSTSSTGAACSWFDEQSESVADTFASRTDNYAKANVVEISGDAPSADSLEAMVDGTGTFELALGRLAISGANGADASFSVINTSGAATAFAAQGGNGHGFRISSHGTGNGMYITADSTGVGLAVIGGDSAGAGFQAYGPAGRGIFASGVGDYGIYATATSGPDVSWGDLIADSVWLRKIEADTTDGTVDTVAADFVVAGTGGTGTSPAAVWSYANRTVTDLSADSTTIVLTDAQVATLGVDVLSISGDATAADNFETMLDGTGGNQLSLGRMVIEGANGADSGSLFITNSTGTAVKWTSTGSNGNAFYLEADGTGSALRLVGGSGGYGLLATGSKFAAGGPDTALSIMGSTDYPALTIVAGSNTHGLRIDALTGTTGDAINLEADDMGIRAIGAVADIYAPDFAGAVSDSAWNKDTSDVGPVDDGSMGAELKDTTQYQGGGGGADSSAVYGALYQALIDTGTVAIIGDGDNAVTLYAIDGSDTLTDVQWSIKTMADVLVGYPKSNTNGVAVYNASSDSLIYIPTRPGYTIPADTLKATTDTIYNFTATDVSAANLSTVYGTVTRASDGAALRYAEVKFSLPSSTENTCDSTINMNIPKKVYTDSLGEWSATLYFSSCLDSPGVVGNVEYKVDVKFRGARTNRASFHIPDDSTTYKLVF